MGGPSVPPPPPPPPPHPDLPKQQRTERRLYCALLRSKLEPAKPRFTPPKCLYDGVVPEDCLTLEEGQLFQLSGATLRPFFTPGHSEDSACFVMQHGSLLGRGG